VSPEQGCHIFFKGTCTILGPGVGLVLSSGLIQVVHVLKVGSGEVAQASAPGVIAVGLLGISGGVCGGAGGAQLNKVFAWWVNVKMGVVVFCMNVDVGVD